MATKKLRSIGAVTDLGCFNIRLPRKPSFKQGFLNRSFPSCLKPLFLSEEQLAGPLGLVVLALRQLMPPLFIPMHFLFLSPSLKGPVVQKPISANPGFNFSLGFFFFSLITFSLIIFPISF